MQRGQIPSRGGTNGGQGEPRRGGHLPGSLSTRNQEPLEDNTKPEDFGAAEVKDEPRLVTADERAMYDYPRVTLPPSESSSGEQESEKSTGIVQSQEQPVTEIDDILPHGRPQPRRGLLHCLGTRPIPKTPYQTRGTTGEDIRLLTNYFKVVMTKDWGLHQYAVDFNPHEDETFIRKAIIRGNRDFIGHRFIFDGGILHTPFLIKATDESGKLGFDAKKRDGTVTSVTIRYLKHTEYGDPIYIHFYNLIVRKCMEGLGLEEIGRGFYDANKPINYPSLNVQLWPGFLTGINHHEEDVLLNVEVTHKVLRTESVLIVLTKMEESHRGPASAFVELANRTLIGSIIMTTYNHATYRVVAVDFDTGPMNTFTKRNGEEISFVDYYLQKHKLKINQMRQPLIIGLPTKRPFKGGDEGDKEVVLIPELCLFTGLTDAMRANNSLMKELASNLHMGPGERIKAIKGFMAELMGNAGVANELTEWGLHFETDLEDCVGRVLPKEKIQFGNGIEMPNDQEDFTAAFRNKALIAPEPLKKWVIFVTKRDSGHVENLVKTMQKVGGPLGVKIDRPDVIQIENPKVQSYVKAIDEHVSRIRDTIQIVFVILGSNSPLVYGAIKKRLAVDFGVSSQCFLAKNLTSRGIMSIATKVVVQMTTKVGAQPWTVSIPLRGLMVVGYDSYNKVHACVASLTPNFTKFFSTITNCEKKGNVSAHVSSDIEKCLSEYLQYNDALPKHVVIYRAGNISHDSGQEEREVAEIQTLLRNFYGRQDSEKPWLTYMVVTKKNNTRLFKEEGRGNPPPGTILDNTVTLKGRFQFFLISSTARQGTVSPCSYQIIVDDSPLNADKLQLLTYKLCHMYFNWSGTVSVPAPVQYAHKLAQITALACDGLPAHSNLKDLLYYL